MNWRTAKAQRGFTLVEVLAALVVLALTLGGIMNATVFYGRSAVYTRDKTIATWVAHNQLVETQLSRQWPETGRSNGRVEMGRQTWVWERVVDATPDERLRRIDMRVRQAGSDEDDWLIKLSAFLAQPVPPGQIAPPPPPAGGPTSGGTNVGP